MRKQNKRDINDQLDILSLIVHQHWRAWLLTAVVMLVILFQLRPAVVGLVAPLNAVYDSLVIMIALSLALALGLMWLVQSNEFLSQKVENLKCFAKYDDRFGYVMGAASILLGLMAWREMTSLSFFGIGAENLNSAGIALAFVWGLFHIDFMLLIWGGLGAWVGHRCREKYVAGERLALVGMIVSIAAVVISFTPIGDILPLFANYSRL